MKKDSFITGTLISYISILIVKVLGVLYVIPFYSIIGEQGGVLYNYAYQIYNLILSITISGIPIAISIIISEYNSLNMIKSKERVFNVANKLIFIISFVCFLLLFVFAGPIGQFFVSGIKGTSSYESLKLVIRSVSFCLLIIPFLSVIRGYLQGHKYVSQTSISQVIEQIVRIAIVLIGSYIVINILNYDISYGVAIALLGAFFGGLFAYLYLNHKRNKYKTEFLKNEKSDEEVVSKKEIRKKIISYSIPIVLVSAISNLYNIIDTKLVILGLSKIGFEPSTTEVIASVISTWAPKICVIIMAIATGMVANIVPHIVNNYVLNKNNEVKDKIDQSLKTMFMISIPTAIGIFMLSKPIYYIFYGQSIYGEKILKIVAIVNIFCCLFTVLNTILQSMKKFKCVYINTVFGLMLTIILDIPFIFLFNYLNIPPYTATLFASILGYLSSCILAIISLHKSVGYKINNILKFLSKIAIPCLFMIFVLIVLMIIVPINIEVGYLKIILTMTLYLVLSTIVYFYISYKMNLLDEVFGYNIINKLKQKFRKK